jgi:hypothetical protein
MVKPRTQKRVDEQSEETGGGDPDGSARGAGQRPRGIDGPC